MASHCFLYKTRNAFRAMLAIQLTNFKLQSTTSFLQKNNVKKNILCIFFITQFAMIKIYSKSFFELDVNSFFGVRYDCSWINHQRFFSLFRWQKCEFSDNVCQSQFGFKKGKSHSHASSRSLSKRQKCISGKLYKNQSF